jgi:molybdopterin molybdotransferase
MEEFISTKEADRIIAETLPDPGEELVPLAEARGRILREAIPADRDYPPFDRVTMDGVALSYAAWEGGTRRFAVVGTQRAGEPRRALTQPDGCLEVMTGAVLPEGCDCVVRVEDVESAEGHVSLKPDVEPKPMHYVHKRGSDYSRGEELLSSGASLSAPQIGILASVGKAEVRVARRPSVSIITTGDELVEVNEPVAEHQIRRSNGYALEAALLASGVCREVRLRHARDDREELHAAAADALAASEVVVLTGGVSMGQFDYVPSVLQALGVRPLFHKVRQRPGKPLWFGAMDGGRVVFGLPGNPVSALVCLYRYVLPQLRQAQGLKRENTERAALSFDVVFKPELTYFLPVCLDTDDAGTLWASPRPTNTSGDFAGLGETDGFVELEPVLEVFPAEYVVPLHRWKL